MQPGETAEMVSDELDTAPSKFALMMPWGRVGSNLVVSALNAAPGIRVLNEPTTVIRSKGQSAGLTLNEIADQQNEHLEEFIQNPPDHTAGLKLAYQSIVQKTAYLEKMAKADFKLVLMVRKNFLKCAISQVRALDRAQNKAKSDQWASPWAVKMNEPKPEATEIDIEKAIKLSDRFEALHYEMLGRVNAVFGRNYLHVEYGELVEDPEKGIRGVFSFLSREEPESIKISHRKATSDRLQDDILNYDAFATAIRDAGKAAYL
ncbi:MAG: hypothetical protein AAFV38_02100 [Pseudomonadota bacterium]